MKPLILLLAVTFSSCGQVRYQDDIRSSAIFKNTEIWDLAQAADEGSVDNFSRLASENPGKLDVQDERYGMTLLMWCVKMEKYEMAKALLERKANPNIRSKTGKTALFYATEFSWLDNEANADPKYVALLLQFGADPNRPYAGSDNSNLIDKGTSPLIHAVSRSFPKVKALVEGGADINYKTERNWTAASEALLSREVDVAYYLIVENKAAVTAPFYFYKAGSDSIDYADTRYPVELLRNWVFDLGSEEHNKKMEIVAEFSRQGADYWKTSPGKATLRHIKERYPDTWEEYVRRY